MTERNRGKERVAITVSREERDRLWRASVEFTGERHEDEYLKEVATKFCFAGLMATLRVDMSGKDSFSAGEMRDLFGVPVQRQRWFIDRGLSPARLVKQRLVYSKDAAIELLLVFGLMEFYPFKSIIGVWGKDLAKEHFLYWTAVYPRLGEIFPETIKVSSN